MGRVKGSKNKATITAKAKKALHDRTIPCCQNCPFYLQLTQDRGTCRYNPPAVVSNDYRGSELLFVEVDPTYLCGRHPRFDDLNGKLKDQYV